MKGKKFTWTKDLEFGESSIDEQHRKFIEMVNELIELVGRRSVTWAELRDTTDKLGNYALYHLENEEEHYKKLSPKDAAIHLEEHRAYREQIKQYGRRIEEGGPGARGVAEELAVFSGNWLTGHITRVVKQIRKSSS